MNEGRICVSVCAGTPEEFIELIGRAAAEADVVELRYDCLTDLDPEDERAVAELRARCLAAAGGKPVIETYRPSEQGGRRSVSRRERLAFRKNSVPGTGADLEEDIAGEFADRGFAPLICSHHEMEGVPADLERIYQRIRDTNPSADIIKIAGRPDEITGSLAVWELLETAAADGKRVIPIAMGEPGLWTRILGPAFGSPLTYASPGTGRETAPGQIRAADMREVYRVPELNRRTDIYGVVGSPVGHSLSPYMHNAAFRRHGLDAVYIPFEVADAASFFEKMVRPETRRIDWNLRGFSVTIPHKERILELVDEPDPTARAIGAVNTVRIDNGRLRGWNTDAPGFIAPLRSAYGSLKNARVGLIGSGGAARACLYALVGEGAVPTIYARNSERAAALAGSFDARHAPLPDADSAYDGVDILVNATPLGTAGALENETPATAAQMKNLHLVYDLVYNPLETLFLREAKSVGIPTIGGLAMLVAQGMKQFEIWTGLDAPMRTMSRAVLQKLK